MDYVIRSWAGRFGDQWVVIDKEDDPGQTYAPIQHIATSGSVWHCLDWRRKKIMIDHLTSVDKSV